MYFFKIHGGGWVQLNQIAQNAINEATFSLHKFPRNVDIGFWIEQFAISEILADFHFLLLFWPFLLDPGVPWVRSLGPDIRQWVSERPFWNLTELTLADEDTNSILTDNVNSAIQGNGAMAVMQPSGQL